MPVETVRFAISASSTILNKKAERKECRLARKGQRRAIPHGPTAPRGARAVCSIDVDAIAVPPERLRKFRPEVVDWLVESITARSVLQSISVRRRGAGYELVAGLHRLEAARKCGHQTIRAEVYDDLGDDEAKLLQIDENLCRAELSPAERAAHLVERKRLCETLHPETGHGGDRRSAEARSNSHSENLKAFVEDTAAKTGKGRSTIAREAKRGADIRDVAQLARISTLLSAAAAGF